ncbi:MAG: TOBE domain-containing protein, partial [Candidatus Krumholzibacteria bacterium]|nr:TOBE domain-containing protein [Candidatus Krumholzibacteria bacterium]
RKKITMVHVTHDYEEAISLATRIGVMENGGIAEVDVPRRIFQHPKSEFVARFVGLRNFFAGKIVRSGQDGDRSAEFICNGLRFLILTDARDGNGSVIIRSEDVTVSTELPSTSARNVFEGTITDIFPVRLGIEVIIDIGVEIAALITQGSTDRLGLRCGRKVFASIKAGAVKYLEG